MIMSFANKDHFTFSQPSLLRVFFSPFLLRYNWQYCKVFKVYRGDDLIDVYTVKGSPPPPELINIFITLYIYLFIWWKHISSTLFSQFSSVAQSCPTLCDPMNRSTPGLPVHHQLLEFTQTHVHQASDAIQPSHPLSSPSPPAPNPSQHQSLFQWVNSSHEVAKVLEFYTLSNFQLHNIVLSIIFTPLY